MLSLLQLLYLLRNNLLHYCANAFPTRGFHGFCLLSLVFALLVVNPDAITTNPITANTPIIVSLMFFIINIFKLKYKITILEKNHVLNVKSYNTDIHKNNLISSSFSLGEKTNSDIKTTPIPILEKSPLSVTRNLCLKNTDRVIELEIH